MSTAIDHIVIGAANLEQGAEFIQRILHVDIALGGVHEQMGTHNLLMRLGEKLFLEVIAIHPELAAPSHPRWFGLDDPRVRQSIEKQPALLTWVANTHNIAALTHRARPSFGQPKRLYRGDLSWLFGLPADGRLLASGLLPYLIEWQSDAHPADNMPDSGCSLREITLYHANPAWLSSALDTIKATQLVRIKSLRPNATPGIVVTLESPAGTTELRSIGI